MPLDPTIAARLVLLDGITWATRSEDQQRLEEFLAPVDGYEPPRVSVTDFDIAGPHGPIPLRTYVPDSPGPDRPALMWLHGGGFVTGDLDMPESDAVAREVCHHAGAVVVAVDYRLIDAETHFPVPLDDVVAAWRWLIDHAAEWGVDPGAAVLGGASAGGNLAAGAALWLRDDSAAQPCALALIYPVLHSPLPPAPAELESALADLPDVLRFTPEALRWLTESYLGGPVATASPYALPSRAELGGVPPALIVAAEYDDLRPSAEVFAEQLTEAGVDTTYVVERGMLHGHLGLGRSVEGADATVRRLIDLVRR